MNKPSVILESVRLSQAASWFYSCTSMYAFSAGVSIVFYSIMDSSSIFFYFVIFFYLFSISVLAFSFAFNGNDL